jgi:hypothetical protein
MYIYRHQPFQIPNWKEVSLRIETWEPISYSFCILYSSDIFLYVHSSMLQIMGSFQERSVSVVHSRLLISTGFCEHVWFHCLKRIQSKLNKSEKGTADVRNWEFDCWSNLPTSIHFNAVTFQSRERAFEFEIRNLNFVPKPFALPFMKKTQVLLYQRYVCIMHVLLSFVVCDVIYRIFRLT